MPDSSLDGIDDEMVKSLADAAICRFYSAQREGLTEHQAFQEIIRTILLTYRAALTS